MITTFEKKRRVAGERRQPRRQGKEALVPPESSGGKFYTCGVSQAIVFLLDDRGGIGRQAATDPPRLMLFSILRCIEK
ncbi:hypothetical protein [Novipirellula rosea]|uniref:hypothetical protein n=1 Tax=Novipirellula rosea TaxID=1031540 RepID=UPI0030EE5E3D|tara:strand:- start:2985 stop:3218 length:234 start_codon:yes stop_codon:yes gene_type:complete